MDERGGFRPDPDYAGLAESLKALAYPARLELLDLLAFPCTVGEIRLSPHRSKPGENPDRPAARPTVQAHVDKLVEAGIAKQEPGEVDGGSATRYVVNPQRLYTVTEALHRLSVRHAGRGLPADATGTLEARVVAEEEQGPRLVLVHGVYEGKAFSLEPSTAQDGKWVIGRKRGLPVSLDYDVYVSVENAVIERRDDAFFITDLEESKNGTFVNWQRLPKGLERELRVADIIGVGRSILVFARD